MPAACHLCLAAQTRQKRRDNVAFALQVTKPLISLEPFTHTLRCQT